MVLFLEQHFILSLQSDFQTTRIQSKTWWMWTMRGSTAGVLRGGPQGLERSTKTDDLSEGMNISLCLQCPVCNSLQGYFAFASLIPADWRQQLLLPHQLWSLLLWNEALQVLRSQRLQLFALNLDPVELCKGGVCSCGTLQHLQKHASITACGRRDTKISAAALLRLLFTCGIVWTEALFPHGALSGSPCQMFFLQMILCGSDIRSGFWVTCVEEIPMWFGARLADGSHRHKITTTSAHCEGWNRRLLNSAGRTIPGLWPPG